jgi:hypothetical protein
LIYGIDPPGSGAAYQSFIAGGTFEQVLEKMKSGNARRARIPTRPSSSWRGTPGCWRRRGARDPSGHVHHRSRDPALDNLREIGVGCCLWLFVLAAPA